MSETSKFQNFPRYRSHKIVQAIKIAGIQRNGPPRFDPAVAVCRGSYALGTACDDCARCKWEKDNPAPAFTIQPAETDVEPFTVDTAFYNQHRPRPGGYIVVYDEGAYVSFSPAAPFEAGYTRLEQ